MDELTNEPINGWSLAGHATKSFGMGVGLGAGIGGAALMAFALGSNPVGWTILAGGLLVGGASAYMARLGDGYDVGVSAPGKAALVAAGDMLLVGGLVEGARGKNSMNGRRLTSREREA